MTEKIGTLNAFLSETGKLFANVQRLNKEGARRSQFPGRRITAGAARWWSFRDSWDKYVPQIFENCLLGHMLPVIAWFKQISDFFDWYR